MKGKKKKNNTKKKPKPNQQQRNPKELQRNNYARLHTSLLPSITSFHIDVNLK